MQTTSNSLEFISDFSKFQTIGYHATSSLVCSEIESHGFLPSKILSKIQENTLIETASLFHVDHAYYKDWVEFIRSVTFTKGLNDALTHIKNGKAGGQAIENIKAIIENICSHPKCGSLPTRTINTIESINTLINNIIGCPPVIYAVNLSELGPRLSEDKLQSFFYYRWDPSSRIPINSEISPERIIEKLTFTKEFVSEYLII